MASQTNTLYVVIDPSGAQAGSNATVNAINSIVQSATQLNVTVNQTNNNLNSMGNNARTNVSSLQRVIRSLTSEFDRLNAVIAAVQPVRMFNAFISEITEVDRVYNGFIAMMNVTTSDVNKSAKEYEYIAKTANAYGVQIKDLLKSYAKLSAATKGVLTESETKKVFQSIVAVSTVLHAESYVVERMFNAIVQMASKGQVHMEELKQQLGEHLPGAMALAASAMDMKMGDMIKAMERGEISARDLLSKLPDELEKRFGDAAEIASKSLTAQSNRLKNVWFDMFKEMSTNGIAVGLSAIFGSLASQLDDSSGLFKVFSNTVGHAMVDVSMFIDNLKPEDVKSFADSLVDVVKAIIGVSSAIMTALNFVIEYKSEFALLGGVLVATRLYWILYTASVSLATGASVMATVALRGLQFALAALYGFAAGWMIGSYLSEQFVEVELAGIALASTLTKAPVQIAAAWERLKVSIPLYLGEAFEGALNQMFKFFDYARTFGDRFIGYLGLNDPKRQKFNFTDGLRAELASIDATASAQLSAIDSTYSDIADEAINRRAASNGNSSSNLLERVGLSDYTIAEARKYFEQLKSLEDEYKALEDHSATKSVKGGAGSSASGKLSRDENALAAISAKLFEAEKLYAMMSLVGEAQLKLNEGDQAALKIREQISMLEEKDVGTSAKAVEAKKLVLGYLNAQLTVANQLSEQLKANSILKIDLKLDEELRLAQMLPKERERENRLLQIKNELLEGGVSRSEAELAAYRERLKLIEGEEKRSSSKGKIQDLIDNLPGGAEYDATFERYKLFANELKALWDEVVIPLQKVEAQIYALNDAFANGAMTQDVYNQKLGEFVMQTSELLNKLGHGDFQTVILQSLQNVMEGFVNLSYNTSELLGGAFNSMVDGLSNAVSRAIVFGENFSDAMRAVASQVVSQLLAGLIKLGIQFLLNKALADVALASSLASQASAAAATAAMWSPAAALASLATMGSNQVPAMAGIAATTAMTSSIAAGSSFAGMFDSGGHIPTGQWGIAGELGPEIVQGPANVVSRVDTAKMLQYSKEHPESNQSIVGALSTALQSVKTEKSAPVILKSVNVIDPNLLASYLTTDEGERLIMNIIQRNPAHTS